MGSYQVVLIESDDGRAIDAVMTGINSQLSGTLYENAWVLHTTEEVNGRNFLQFQVRLANVQQALKEIRNYTQFNRIYHIYTSMCDIGKHI